MSTAAIQLPSDQSASGRTLGAEEIKNLVSAIESGTLTSTKGTFVKEFETQFADRLGAKFGYASSSGTAALHVAYAAINPNPGDEFITTPITDMGAITPIMFQGAIPVFADVDPTTCNVTAETIAARISEKTKAIIVTHLFGNPCEMQPIMELAKSHNIPVIEDCAQAFLAEQNGQMIGTFGDIGCFSLQQGKHITTGEGGVTITNNEEYARHIFLYINKAWGYGDEKPDHYFSALNYRMNELTGAVALAQLEKLEHSVNVRVEMADLLHDKLKNVAGIQLPVICPNSVHTYWKFCLNIDEKVITGGTVALGTKLREYGIFSAPRYIQKPAFQCQVIRDQKTLGNSNFPFNLARPEAIDYRPQMFPGAFAGLDQILVLPWNEGYTPEHVECIANSILSSVNELKG